MMAVAALFAAVLFAPIVANAQPVSAERCTQAVATVQANPLPELGDLDWYGWEDLRRCGAIGERQFRAALASKEIRTSTDTLRVRQLLFLWAGYRAPEIVRAYTELAVAPSSTTLARRDAVRLLGTFVVGNMDFDPEALAARPTPQCHPYPSLGFWAADAPPMTSTFLQEMVETFQSIESAATVPADIQALARCWRRESLRRIPPTTMSFSLRYVCGNTFVVRNFHLAPQSVRLEVLGSDETMRFMISGDGAERRFSTEARGTVQLWLGTTLTQSTENRNTRCP
jgi:hypothetical protein